jgi:hypothetical protein
MVAYHQGPLLGQSLFQTTSLNGNILDTSRGPFPPWGDSSKQYKSSEITVADAFRRRKKIAASAVLNESVLLLGKLLLHQGDEMIRSGIE